jgi:hypothetical protein
MATFRLTAAGLSARRRAAAEKLAASAVRTKDSRFARVSRNHLQRVLESPSTLSWLILGEFVVTFHSGTQGVTDMPAASLKNGLNALLTPDESVLILIDHQPFQFANLHSHEPMMIVNNVIGLAKAAKIFNVPTILTTVVEDRGGKLIKGLQDVFPDQKPIDRTFINTWEDLRVVEAVKRTGRKKLVMAALWTEICLAMPGDPSGRRGLRGLRRDGRLRRRQRGGPRHGNPPHHDGRCSPDELAGSRE